MTAAAGIDDLKELVIRLAVIAERLDARSEAAVQRIERTGTAMDQGAGQLAASGAAFARQALQALDAQAGEVLRHGLAQAMGQCEAGMREASRHAAATAHELAQAREALRRERRRTLWLGSGALLVGAVLAVGASLYAATASHRQVQADRAEARLLRAVNRADLTLCGERLCANVERDGGGVGARGRYLPVRPR